jgi:hypothetical protein
MGRINKLGRMLLAETARRSGVFELPSSQPQAALKVDGNYDDDNY